MLKGKVALVTGGGQGIGRVIAYRLSEKGATVAVADIDLNSAEETTSVLKGRGAVATAFQCNVAEISDVEFMVGTIIEMYGKVDILINNAGITRDSLLLRMKETAWDTVLNVNLKGVFNCTRATVRSMSRNRYGRIVNVASIVGETGNAGQCNYSASKAGVIGLTKSVAREFASRNINCNAVAPGFIETSMTEKLTDNVKKELLSRIPMGRLGRPSDVADGVFFLVSDASNYITGQVIDINGGMRM